MKKIARGAVVALMALGLSVSCAALVGKYQFYVKDGALVRGTSALPFTIRAVETTELANPKTFTPLALTQTIMRVSDVGVTTIGFDLYGISADGKTLAPASVDIVSKIVAQMTWRQMGALCKVFGPDAPTDPAARKAAAKTVAKAMKKNYAIMYWIDGPDAAELVKEFKNESPELIVAAPTGGDLTTSAAPAGPLSLVVGSIPTPLTPAVHCLTSDTPENLQAYDKALADPIESQPWTPDNSALTEEERKDGWIALFDGKTLNGWTITGPNKQGFVARNGIIEWNAKGANQLRSRDRYGDLIMRFDYKIGEGNNSGVQYHTPRANRASTIGFEFQILGDHKKPADKQSTGSIYDVVPPKLNATNPDGEWNTVEITLKGPHVTAYLNGKLVQDLSFDDNDELRPRNRNGFIVITDHGGYCAYRNLRLKKL